MRSLRSWLAVGARMAALAFVLWMMAPADVWAQDPCSGPNLVVFSFPAGTSWRLCWEKRTREGLTIRAARYQARGDTLKTVLYQGNIAQVHVPYYPSTPRFRDVTVSTGGLGAGMLNLNAAECDGTILAGQVCREQHTEGLAFKYSNISQRASYGVLWSSSQLGQYNYIIKWVFRDDGTIEPTVGFTGRLQIIDTGGGSAQYGTPVDPPAQMHFARNHIHNIYWRFDFDIVNSTPNAVDGMYQYELGPGGCMPPGCSTYFGRFTTENVDYLWPYSYGQPFQSYRIFNTAVNNLYGRPVGYELYPTNNLPWYGDPGGSENWSYGDIFVTGYQFCEQLATDNQTPFIDPSCMGYPYTDLSQYIDGVETVDGGDVVVWYNTRFRHLTREEDQLNMPIEYQSVDIHPWSWRHKSTLEQ